VTGSAILSAAVEYSIDFGGDPQDVTITCLNRKRDEFVEVVDVLGSRRRMFGSRHEAVAWLRALKSVHT
jgi:hypothetical protein